eukprot:Em0001g3059a
MRSDGEMYSQDAEQSDHGDVKIACSEETIDTEAVDLSNCSVRPRFVPDNAENDHDVVDDEKACGEVQESDDEAIQIITGSSDNDESEEITEQVQPVVANENSVVHSNTGDRSDGMIQQVQEVRNDNSEVHTNTGDESEKSDEHMDVAVNTTGVQVTNGI